MQASVNVSSGNLLLHETDLQIAGTGLDVSLDRFYNSLSTTADPSRLSPGWSLGTAPTVRLEFPGTTGRVVFVGPSSYRVRFDTNAAGDYVHAEPGVDADLEFDTASNTYRLEWFNRATYVFDTAGKLLRTQDG